MLSNNVSGFFIFFSIVRLKRLTIGHQNLFQNNICIIRIVSFKHDDPYGIRTRDTAVKGRCLNHLTKGPLFNYIYCNGPE